MTEYLFLFRGGEAGRKEDQESPEKWQTHMQKWMDWMDGLTQQGRFGGAQPLKGAGKVIRSNGKVVTDGPFTEGKEIVGGYLVCKADSFEDAVELSKGCPILEYDDATVEVREINVLTM